jgi:hypothetical protein
MGVCLNPFNPLLCLREAGNKIKSFITHSSIKNARCTRKFFKYLIAMNIWNIKVSESVNLFE